MVILRYGIWCLFIIPTVISAIALVYVPKVIFGNEALTLSITLSLVGVALSYYGLLFSFYAALEVQHLSSKYLFKLRSPDILRSLNSISKSVSSLAGEPSDQLRSQSFFHEIPVAIRASKKMKSAEVRRVATEAETAFNYLMVQADIVRPIHTTAGQIDGYWKLFSKISELAQEMKEQLKNVSASA